MSSHNQYSQKHQREDQTNTFPLQNPPNFPIILILLLLIIIHPITPFHFPLKINQKKCFISTIFPSDRLSIDLQLPIISQQTTKSPNSNANFHLEVFQIHKVPLKETNEISKTNTEGSQVRQNQEKVENVENVDPVTVGVVDQQKNQNPNSKDKKVLIYNYTMKDVTFKYTIHQEEVQNAKNGGNVDSPVANKYKTNLQYEVCLHLRETPNQQQQKQSSSPQNGANMIIAGIQASGGKDSLQKAIADNLPFISSPKSTVKTIPSKYLISLKLLTNFKHELHDKINTNSQSKSSSFQKIHKYTSSNLKELTANAQKLYEISQQQINLHIKNEQLQLKTDEHVKDIVDEIFSYSIMQSALLLFGSMMHINMLRWYMEGNKIV